MLIQAADVRSHSLIFLFVNNLPKEREMCPAVILELTFFAALQIPKLAVFLQRV